MATTHKIGETVFTTPSDHELVLTRVVDAPRALVWDAWTSPEHVPHWMLGPDGWTMPTCEIDLRPGGPWRFVWRQDDDGEMAMNGQYTEVEPPQRLVNTESWGPQWPEIVNTLLLTEENGRTTITQIMAFPSEQAREDALRTGMKEGMTMSMDRLGAYLRRMA
jgi:uncharacterized protein YndB with AHSA1/START domain